MDPPSPEVSFSRRRSVCRLENLEQAACGTLRPRVPCTQMFEERYCLEDNQMSSQPQPIEGEFSPRMAGRHPEVPVTFQGIPQIISEMPDLPFSPLLLIRSLIQDLFVRLSRNTRTHRAEDKREELTARRAPESSLSVNVLTCSSSSTLMTSKNSSAVVSIPILNATVLPSTSLSPPGWCFSLYHLAAPSILPLGFWSIASTTSQKSSRGPEPGLPIT